MDCICCQTVVRIELDRIGLRYSYVKIGEVEIPGNVARKKLQQLAIALQKSGLVLMEDNRNILIEKIKGIIIRLVNLTEEQIKVNLSDYLSEKLNYDYTYLSKLFSETEDTTIENFYLTQRIEKVKELIVYNELNFTEIAYLLHYSSVAHLSNQFKKYTGQTPSVFKKLRGKRKIRPEKVK